MSDLNTPDPVWGLLAVLAWLFVALIIAAYWKDIRAFARRRSRHGRNPDARPDAMLDDLCSAVHDDRVRAGNRDDHAGNAEPYVSEPVHFADAESFANAFGDVRPNGSTITLASTEHGYDAFSRDVRERRQNSDGDDLARGERPARRNISEDERDASVDHPHGSGELE